MRIWPIVKELLYQVGLVVTIVFASLKLVFWTLISLALAFIQAVITKDFK